MPFDTDMGWISHCKMQQTMKKVQIVLTQVVANRTSLKALFYWPSLLYM